MTTATTNDPGQKQDISGRLAFLGIEDINREQIRKAKDIVERELPVALDRFYEIVRNTPETKRFFSSDEHMRGAKNAQLAHWGSITTGEFNEDYVARVRKMVVSRELV
ncbi:MAG: hypothetical protein Kow0026_26020 [Oricola sp.]